MFAAIAAATLSGGLPPLPRNTAQEKQAVLLSRQPTFWPRFNAFGFPPIADLGRNSFRTPDRKTDRFYILQTRPSDGWQTATLPPAAFNPALYVPAVALETQPVYLPRPSVVAFGLQQSRLTTPWPQFNEVIWPAIPISADRARDVAPDRSVLQTQPTWPPSPPAAPTYDASLFPPIADETRSGGRTDARPSVVPQTGPEPVYKGSVSLLEIPELVPVTDGQRNNAATTPPRADRAARQTAPDFAWVATPVNSALAASWPAVEQATGRSFRTRERASKPIQTAPNDGWIYAQVSADIARFRPAVDQVSYRTPDRLTDRTLILQGQPEPNFEGAVFTFEAYLYPPIGDAQQRSYRTPARSSDVRPTQPNDGWIYTPVGAAIAANWPAIKPDSYRTPARDARVIQTQPSDVWYAANFPGVTTAQTWPAIELGTVRSYRAIPARPDRFVLQTQPEPVYKASVTLFEAFQYVPSGDQLRLAQPFRGKATIPDTQPEPIYTLAPAFNAALYVPITDEGRNAYRTAARRQVLPQTEPNQGWIYRVVDAETAKQRPALNGELATYRTPPRRQTPIPTEPQPAWIQTAIAPFFVPAMDAQRNNSSRTPAGPPNRVYSQTAPLFTWAFSVVNAANATYWPAIEESLRSFRTDRRAQDRTLILQGQPARSLRLIDFVIVPELPEADNIWHATRRRVIFRSVERGVEFTLVRRGVRFNSEERGTDFNGRARSFEFDPDEE